MSVAVVPALPAEPPPPDQFAVEALVAAVGIEPFVSHSLRKVTQAQLQRALALPAEIDRKLLRFCTREEREPTADLPPFDFAEVKGWLLEQETPEQVQKTIAAFTDGDFALAVTQVVNRIRTYLTDKIPRRIHISLTGPEEEEPARVDVARFRRLWNVACDPVGILDDLNEFALSRGQVADCADMFPQVWARMNSGIDDVLRHKKTVDPRFQCPRRKEAFLRILGKRDDKTSLQLAQDIQAMFAQQAAEAQPKPQPNAKRDQGASSESTAAQLIT